MPSALTALMSAVPQDSSEPSSGPSGTHTFHFKQDVPIPSYLLALAVGDLEYRQIGPISKVTPPAVFCFPATHHELKSALFVLGNNEFFVPPVVIARKLMCSAVAVHHELEGTHDLFGVFAVVIAHVYRMAHEHTVALWLLERLLIVVQCCTELQPCISH